MESTDLEADIEGILSLLRTHIEVRNRSWMKRVHRDCFIGSDAVDFLITQGLADTRSIAVKIGQKMIEKKMIRHVTDSRKNFRDAYLYYRFAEDDVECAVLGTSCAGNGTGVYPGHGGCKFSFAPHTAHNSYVLDIALAEEIERAVAGASVEARARAFGKLRARVREQAEPDAPDWSLIQSTEVNKTVVSVYERKRPRGDFKNVRLTAMAAESPKSFATGILGFERRRQWEGMFEDGVVVEGIDIGEQCPLFKDEDSRLQSVADPLSSHLPAAFLNPSSPSTLTPARKTDDLLTFLLTVDLAGIPQGMPIGFLNDPERQHALAHLRKQMMLSNPQECMLCQAPFDSAADIRFCPCCAMVSCVSCVSKRVFEVVSRQVVNVCVHCVRESSRIRYPPQAVQDTTGLDAGVKGKWWRPEELGLVDYSLPSSSAAPTPLSDADPDSLEIPAGVTPLVPGILDAAEADNDADIEGTQESFSLLGKKASGDEAANEDSDDDGDNFEGDLGDGIGQGVNENDFAMPTPPMPVFNTAATPTSPTVTAAGSSGGATPPPLPSPSTAAKMARCKTCGEMIPRDIESIEKHMEECVDRSSRLTSTARSMSFSSSPIEYYVGSSNGRVLGGITRKSDFDKCGTRVIYRTSRSQSKRHRPREVCALQDAFVDPDGTCYVYEISVRHCDVRGIQGYVTADTMLLLHVARPVRGSKSTCNISIISQVDTRAKGPQMLSFLESGRTIGAMNKEDLVRELQACGNLQNILKREQQAEQDDAKVALDDFELLAVLGRGGFGKVMQVRYIPTKEVYAMKILKKTELRRRRQVERTQTERTILAAVQHPFIVCLHYAFQSPQKLYMVMDFVQGGDFFTLMRKFRRLPEDWVRVYVCQIAMALQHLHDMDVVYRDLKPENILLCGDGYLKLTDFGLSRFFEMRPPAAEDMIGEEDVVTRSFCGTEQYMSPEMLLQQGHNFRMDWWCVGLLMHEMISARHPFHGPSHYDTLRNMVTKQPTIDARLSTNAATVVRSLLIKNPRARLCCCDGIKELYSLPYFSCINWEALYEKKIPMPYKPDLTDATDVSSFETTFTREAAVDSVVEPSGGKGGAGGKKGGIMGMIFGSNNPAPAAEEPEVDAFKGFSFAKEDPSLPTQLPSETDASGTSASTSPVASRAKTGGSAPTSPAKPSNTA